MELELKFNGVYRTKDGRTIRLRKLLRDKTYLWQGESLEIGSDVVLAYDCTGTAWGSDRGLDLVKYLGTAPTQIPMNQRAEIAAHIMAQIMAYGAFSQDDPSVGAIKAVKAADALIAELNKLHP